jgi:hypothetical protein
VQQGFYCILVTLRVNRHETIIRSKVAAAGLHIAAAAGLAIESRISVSARIASIL